MGMISGPPIRILDVENAEGFVQRCIDKSQIPYGPDEREELLAEGLTILCALAGKYKPLPMRPGIDKQAGRFSGYAAMFLPRRLGDFWHQSHPEHRYITDAATGKRGWHYGQAAISLDGLNSLTPGADPERHLLKAKTINAFCHATHVVRPQPRP